MKSTRNLNTRQLLLGAGLGAALMYLLDPDQGGRRRSLARGRMARLGRSGREFVDARVHELEHLSTRPAEPRHVHLPAALAAAAGIAVALGVVRHGTRHERAGQRIEVQKTIEIAASPEQVFDVWSNYENFPRFMSMVEEVRALDADRSHWVVKGPAGTRLEWDSVLTGRERGRLLAWRSEPGGPVQHEGRVALEAVPGGTRATVWMAYRPPGGALGHKVASLFGRNPQQEMDTDLAHMKAFIEEGANEPGIANRTPQGAGRSDLPGAGVRH